MMVSMSPKPLAKYYSFDSIRGYPRDPSGAAWQAFNPNYDPGPLPPPREPRSQNQNKTSDLNTIPSTGSALISVSPTIPLGPEKERFRAQQQVVLTR